MRSAQKMSEAEILKKMRKDKPLKK